MKYSFVGKIFIAISIFVTFTGYSQNQIERVVKSYFRSNPFEIRFSSFIATLKTDPWFKIKTHNPRTDSSFLFLEGSYKYFNPFEFFPQQLNLSLVEKEFIHMDSSYIRATIIFMQLTAITDTGRSDIKLVQKELKRFHNNQSGRLPGYFTYKSHEDKGQKIVEIYSYIVLPSGEPITVA